MPTDLLRIGGRVVAGFGAAVAAAVLAAGATLLPVPGTASGAAGTVIQPVPVEQQRACPGPLLTVPAGATALESSGAPALAAGTLAAPGATVTGIASPDVPVAQDGTGPFVVTAPSAAAPDALLAASQAQNGTGDVAGLAAAACAEGAAESWILAGATDTGRTSLLMLGNPGAVPAAVDLTLYTAGGAVQAPGLTGIVVPPFTQRTVSLAGYAPGEAQLAVQVRSRGGLVAATLQQTVVRGLETGGVDLVGPTAPASLTPAIPGIRITTADAAAARAQAPGAQDVGTVVRLLAPGDGEEVDVTITLTPETGEGTVLEAPLHAGAVVDVPIDGLAEGVYTATITASAPLLASARVSAVAPPLEGGGRAGTSGSSGSAGSAGDRAGAGAPGTVAAVVGQRIDLAWFVAAGPLTAPAAFSTADAPAPRLAIANPGTGTATITLDSVSGPYTAEILPGASIGVDLAPQTVHVLTASAPVEAAVSYAGDGQLASFPVRAANPLATPLTIYR